MTYDLRVEPWLPFLRLSGAKEWGPPELMVDAIDVDPIVALAAPRPDFDGALSEFLIGLLTAAYPLDEESSWRALWNKPPTRNELRTALMRLPAAFDLDGDEARFLQDYSPNELATAEISPVQELLVEGKNDPLFIKPQTLRQLGRPAVAAALVAIQSYSPAGGRGYRTSLRGGGPLTTLVDPRPSAHDAPPIARSLWRHLWANVLTNTDLRRKNSESPGLNAAAHIFPWLAPTRTSENDRATTVVDADPLQCFFGMPRRISLEFRDGAGTCDLTGREDQRLVTGFRVKGYGVQYQGWRHPLSPYYAGKQPNEWLPLHGQPGGVGWRDWYPLLYKAPNGSKMPARVVSVFNERRADAVGCSRYELHVFGFDVTNAKVRSWIDARVPAFAILDEERLSEFASLVSALTSATELAAYTLQRTVIAALYSGPDDPPGDLSFAKASLWNATESEFYRLTSEIVGAADLAVAAGDACRRFQTLLLRTAVALFDDNVGADDSQPEQLRRSVVARFDLVTTLTGGGKQGEKFFGLLGLGAPRAKRTPTAKKRATDKEVRA